MQKSAFLGLLKDKAVIRRENLLLALNGMVQRHVSYIYMLPPDLIFAEKIKK